MATKKNPGETKGAADCCDRRHPDHAAELPRLNRVAGQIEGVKRMIAERRYCPDILTQLRAVRAALTAIEGNLLETHLGACVTEAFDGGNEQEKQGKIAELKEIYRRFNG